MLASWDGHRLYESEARSPRREVDISARNQERGRVEGTPFAGFKRLEPGSGLDTHGDQSPALG